MPLHIIVGYDGPLRTAKPSLVYLGESFAEAEKAMTQSTADRFSVHRNPLGYRKHNPHRERNLAAQSAKPAPAKPAAKRA